LLPFQVMVDPACPEVDELDEVDDVEAPPDVAWPEEVDELALVVARPVVPAEVVELAERVLVVAPAVPVLATPVVPVVVTETEPLEEQPASATNMYPTTRALIATPSGHREGTSDAVKSESSGASGPCASQNASATASLDPATSHQHIDVLARRAAWSLSR
jgi:hypothetical protein